MTDVRQRQERGEIIEEKIEEWERKSKEDKIKTLKELSPEEKWEMTRELPGALQTCAPGCEARDDTNAEGFHNVTLEDCVPSPDAQAGKQKTDDNLKVCVSGEDIRDDQDLEAQLPGDEDNRAQPKFVRDLGRSHKALIDRSTPTTKCKWTLEDGQDQEGVRGDDQES